jgi:predicted Rossmann-fold nucleotide-binding protein
MSDTYAPLPTVNARISPRGGLDILSRAEIARLTDATQGSLRETLRRCALAVLTVGSDSDDPRAASARYPDFEIEVQQMDRGIRLELKNAPAIAFVDGELIRGVGELLFAVVRDIAYTAIEVQSGQFDLETSEGLTSVVFEILRNARAMRPHQDPNLIVCWGGHSIGREEYLYTKRVGYELGLRGLDICTGCGPGAMKGPMKGATIAHAKQRHRSPRYIGMTEPGIIAAESPNPIVNELVILPDMEKRLEAFVRTAHSIIIFPGGVGTAEEILFLLGILLHPANAEIPVPLILTGPESSRSYLERVDGFIGATLGREAQQCYRIIIGDAGAVAAAALAGVRRVQEHRQSRHDAYFYNWNLYIDREFQQPFKATHESMAALDLRRDQPAAQLAANLRRAFSGVVSGNIREEGIRAIEAHGPFELRGDPAIMRQLDELLAAFVAQQRMRLPGKRYEPCYRVVV